VPIRGQSRACERPKESTTKQPAALQNFSLSDVARMNSKSTRRSPSRLPPACRSCIGARDRSALLARSEGAELRNFASESNDLQVLRRTVLDGMLDALLDVFLP
jgi:hypothetical protein